jgi:peptidoglycan/xylan/chitin deacetylase (PgdA/CDA1 family)
VSWHANLQQQLSSMCEWITRRMRTILSSWPGLVTLSLLLLSLTIGLALFSPVDTEAVAQAPSPTARLQGTPTRRATSTPTKTATRRAPTPTWTTFPTATATKAVTHSPTATQVASSPLVMATSVTTQVMPLPTQLSGTQIVPEATITEPVTSITPELTPELTPEIASETPSPTSEAQTYFVPTPTAIATLSINEALEQPVAPDGIAGIIASATAEAFDNEASGDGTQDEAQNEQTVEEASPVDAAPTEVLAETAAPPVPVPTAAIDPTSDGTLRTVHVPILMYHYLSVPPENANIYRQDLSVSPELFVAHLDAMQQAGYTSISLYALIDHLNHGTPLPEKPVVLTFDDGYRDNYTNAFPLLRERGMTATFFLVTDFINNQVPEYLTWDMVREMYAGGMSIEAHGRNHVSLANKDNDYLIWQALGNIESIELEVGVRPRFICYPAGEFDQRTIDIFRSANFWAGFTTKQGATQSSDNLFQMPRIRMRGTTSPEELLRLLALDW